MVTLHLHVRKHFKKASKKVRLSYGAESHVEVRGFSAKHYDALLDLATVGFYKKFIKDVICKMNIQPSDRILDMGAGTGRNDILMLGFKQEDRIKIIENANKALKKEGKFFVLDYNEFDLSKKPAYVRALFGLECDLARDYIKRNWKKIWKEHGFSVQNKYLYFMNLIRLLELEKY